jgi:drug/metabolite transporter (DMT)-like permease
MAAVSGIACHIMTVLGVQRAGAERSSFAGVFEIATSLVLGWVVFIEPFSFYQFLGVFLIVAALFLTRRLEVGFHSKRIR